MSIKNSEKHHTNQSRSSITGALWMLLACAMIGIVSAIGRYAATHGVPPLQVVFLRLLFASIVLSFFLIWRGPSLFQTNQWRLYGIRVFLGLTSLITWFTALSMIPIGKVTAISFLAPLFATISAVLILGERVHARRWAALAVGFGGALIILRPGFIEVSLGVWLVMLSALTMGLSTTFIKRLTNADDPNKIVFITHLLMTPIMLLPAIVVWQWPPAHVWPWLIAFGPVATIAHISMARAFAATDASIVMGIDFARLPFAVLLGYLLFGEVIDLWTWLGAGVIFASTVYVARSRVLVK